MRAGELRALKERVEEELGFKPRWQKDLPWFEGSNWADLPEGGFVSVYVCPPKGQPQIYGVEIGQRSKEWVTKSHEQMRMIFG